MEDKKLLKWQQLKKKMKSAVFIEIVVWICILTMACSISYGVFYYKFIKPNLYNVAFSDIDGLINGSPVRFMGIMVGHVRNLTYHKDLIDVEIIITKKDTKIPQGSIASVEFSGIAGSKSIEIFPPNSDLSDIGIVAKPTLRLTEVFDSLQYMGKAFSSLKDLVDSVNQDTVLKVFATVSVASEGARHANKSVEDTQAKYKQFEKKMDNVVQEQKKLGTTLDKINDNVNSYLKN